MQQNSDPYTQGELDHSFWWSSTRQIIDLSLPIKWPGKEAEDKNKRDILPGQIRVKLWLGLEKDEKVWLNEHTDENENGEISILK